MTIIDCNHLHFKKLDITAFIAVGGNDENALLPTLYPSTYDRNNAVGYLLNA